MRRDNSQADAAASALPFTTNEAKFAAVDAYIKAQIPQEGVQDVANTNVAGVLRTMDCPKCSIQALYPRADGALRRGECDHEVLADASHGHYQYFERNIRISPGE